jgi:hypothetical protein
MPRTPPKLMNSGAMIYINDDKQWHREGGPAIIHSNGGKEWWLNDRLHRVDGPAIEFSNGFVEWYLDGHRYHFERWLELTPKSEEEKLLLKLQYG